MDLKELSTLVDMYDTVKQNRLEHDRISRSLKEEETAMKDRLIAALQEHGMSAAGGSTVHLSLRRSPIAKVADWDTFYDYIKSNDAFDCLNRAVNQRAVAARLLDGPVPGTEQIWQYTLSESRANVDK